MFYFYSIKPNFYPLLQQFPMLCSRIDEIEEKQRSYIFDYMDIFDLKSSASTYFEQKVDVDQEVIRLEDKLQQTSYEIIVKNRYICFDDYKNPFVKLILRKYPYNIILSKDR